MWVVEIDLYNKRLKKHISLCYHKVSDCFVTKGKVHIYGDDLNVMYNFEQISRIEVYKEV